MLNCLYGRIFAQFLEDNKQTLVFSTYQANRLAFLSSGWGELDVFLVEHSRPMGIAVCEKSISLAENEGVTHYRSFPPDGLNYAAFNYTGLIDLHEIAYGNGNLWGINTMFSCICRFKSDYNFVPNWRPPFISEYQPQDRCHLNGMAMWRGLPRFVTYLGASDETFGWDKIKKGGAVMDITTNEIVIERLDAPHSPRIYQDKLYVCESGCGKVLRADLDGGKLETVLEHPGYLRGLAFLGEYAFVGVSKCRKTGIGESAILLLDLKTGNLLCRVTFLDQISEIFDIQLINHPKPIILDRSNDLLRTTYGIPNQK